MAGSSKDSGDESGLFQKVFTEGPLEELTTRCDVITAASLVGSSKLFLDSAKDSATLPASLPFGLPCVLHSHPKKIPRDCFDGESLPCKLTPLDRFSFDAVTPDGTKKQWAGANGDWIATVGLDRDWELVNVYTRRTISLPAVPFEATERPDTFLNNDLRNVLLQKIAICQVPTAAGRYKDFSLIALFDDSVAFLHGHDDGWIVLPNQSLIYCSYTDAIFHDGLVFATTEIGTVYAWHPRNPGSGLLMLPPRFDRWLDKLEDALGHEHHYDYGMWWLARSPDGSRLLLVHTRGIAGDQDIHCPICLTTARPNVVRCDRTVSTYASAGLGCLVFSTDTSQLNSPNVWERIDDLGAYSLFLGVNYPIIMPVGDADLAPGYLTRSNCVYTSHYAIGLYDPPLPEICRFSLDDRDAALGFSTDTAFSLHEMLNDDIDPTMVKTPLWFIPSFRNALDWNRA